MSSCLGINIQDNLIKYAKVSKEKNNAKIEAYGVKFCENDIEKTIEQIIKETFSYQIPMSVNISNDQYAYTDVFNLLKPKDMEKAIKTEFDFFCSNNNKNRNTLEFRKIQTQNLDDRDKKRIIYAYTDKTNIVERIQLLNKYKISNISPVATIIQKLNSAAVQENTVIINIEETTEITTLVNGEVYKVDRIEQGMKNILDSIALKENSIQKAYEICKNTTVYTKSGQNVRIEGNEYLDEIITSLFEIIEKVKGIIASNEIEINNIYVSGMGVIINNIDLLFQEAFLDKKCEILVPYFVEKTNVKINIKDYLEVNSAIALALQGLDTKKQDMNFNEKNQTLQRFWELLNSDTKDISIKTKQKPKLTFKQRINVDLDKVEIAILRSMTGIILLGIIYIATSKVLMTQINEKIDEAQKNIDESNKKIATIDEYNKLINDRTSQYQQMINSIDEANSRITENYSSKNAVPNLLNKIMYNIPKGVQLLSIDNASGKNITIEAQADLYDQLGYFKAALEEEGILTNVTTTKGVKQNGKISITITGSLPY